MRGDFLKAKALFMAIIIIAAIFTVHNVKLVSAEETNYCCEQTTGGQSCQYTSLDECNATAASSAVTCEQTSYCKGGCCISTEGKCSKNVPKSTCEATPDYEWYDDVDCNIAQCEKQCCSVANSICAYTTSAHCETINENYPEVEAEFVEVEDEYACNDICTSSDKGCCVTSDDCIYDSKEMCETPDIDLEAGTGFYKERYCSELNLCGCISQSSTACVGEDVYYFDSCGNQEGIANDCDYTNGDDATWCGTDGAGNAYCKELNCESTFNGNYPIGIINNHDGRLGLERKHGESWCLYESPAGNYLDRPGSQHYRTFCYFGEEIIDPCRDYREEICIQSPFNGGATEYTGAACIDNNIYDSIINTNISTVPKGNKFWAETSDDCSAGASTCEVVFSKESRTATKWKCASNCHCLSEGWMINASKVCSSQGDCGPNYNILDDYNDDGFYISRSEDTLLANKKYTVIAYDKKCEGNKVNQYGHENYEASTHCAKSCTGSNTIDQAIAKGSTLTEENCIFYNSLNQTPWYTGEGIYLLENQKEGYLYDEKTLKDAQGVHGGLLAISELMEQALEADEDVANMINARNQAFTVIGGVAAGIAVVTYMIAGMVASAATAGAVAGTAATTALQVLFNVAGAAGSAGPVGAIVAIAAILVAVLMLIFLSGGETTTVTITASCEPWISPVGGENCELCDLPVSQGGLALDDGEGNILPGYDCSEYKCRSLGAACEYIEENAGTNREKCFNAYVNDVTSPDISLNEDIWITYYLNNDEIEWETDDEGREGWAEISGIPPYTQFHFGIKTNELSQCKIDTTLADNYDSMGELFPNSYYSKDHNQTRVLTPDEEATYYIRCQDPQGNYNIDAFVIKAIAAGGEDVQAPVIQTTDIASGSYIASNTPEVVLNIFINEPVATCKWSTSDQDYDVMENPMICTSVPASQSVYGDYYCYTLLNVTEIGENYFYFACEDAAGNKNSQSYEYMLRGTETLNIDRTSPNGTLYYNDVALQVETSVGAQNGAAVCYYDGIQFFTTNSSYHEQLFEDLSENTYSYDILCQDVAGNQNSTSITFTVDVDETAPTLTDLYIKENTIYFSTDETTTCEYSSETFTFGEGISTTGTIAMTEISTYYLSCEDEFGNEESFIIEV